MNIVIVFVICFVAFFLLYVCIPLRLIVFNFLTFLFYLPIDVVLYFTLNKFNVAPVGFINLYTGLFGRGKTLSAVHYVTKYFKRYNNKRVWNNSKHKFEKQYVNVLSNVKLAIPYKEFVSMDQLVEVADTLNDIEEKENCSFVTISLIDEVSTCLNSRSFKTNFSTPMLNALLTCRHQKTAIIGTCQRFGHADALLRQVTTKVIECRKIWRFQCQYYYDAWDLENAGSPQQVKPLRRTGFFVRNKDYNAYDTRAVVSQLIKDYKAGNMLSDAEIMALRGESELDINNVRHLTRKARKRLNKAV